MRTFLSTNTFAANTVKSIDVILLIVLMNLFILKVTCLHPILLSCRRRRVQYSYLWISLSRIVNCSLLIHFIYFQMGLLWF